MRNIPNSSIFIVLGIILWVSASAYAQIPASPRLAVDNQSQYLGVHQEGEMVPFEFVLSNTGDGPLEILDVSATCGCTNVRVEENTVNPGKATRLLGTFDTRGRQGLQSKSITIKSNDPVHPRMSLTITCQVFEPIQVVPRFIRFGTVENDSPATHTLNIESRMQEPFDPKIELEGLPALDYELIEREVIPPNSEDNPSTATITKMQIMLKLKPKAPIGRFSGQLILSSGDKSASDAMVMVQGNVIGDLQFTPNQLIFRSLEPGSEQEQTLSITSEKGVEYEIESVEAENLDLSWEVTPAEEPHEKTLTIKLNDVQKKDLNRVNKYQLDLKTTHPEHPDLTIPVILIWNPEN